MKMKGRGQGRAERLPAVDPHVGAAFLITRSIMAEKGFWAMLCSWGLSDPHVISSWR